MYRRLLDGRTAMMTLRSAAIHAALAFIFLLVPGRASAQQTNAFESLKAAYANESLAIRMAFGRQTQEVLAQYGKALDMMMTALRKRGDLKTYLVVETEQKRFSAEGTVPQARDAVPAIADAVNAYQRAVAGPEIEMNRQTVVLLRKYGVALDNLVRQYMQADKIDEAKAVQAERDRVVSELAALESKLPKVATTGVPAPAVGDVGWFVLFRSDNPKIWNTKVGRSRDSEYAVPVSSAPYNTKYIRVRRMDSKEYVITAVRKADLLDQRDDGRYGWNGKANWLSNGHHLGIYGVTLYSPNVRAAHGAARGKIFVGGAGGGGWGFGHIGYVDTAQGYGWKGEPLAPTVFEIAVKASPLRDDEKKHLLAAVDE
jgi:hypothetical protein